MKECTKCFKEKPFTEFHKSKNHGGYYPQCKECRKPYCKKWAKERKVELNAYQKRYRIENIEKIKEYIELNKPHINKNLRTRRVKDLDFRIRENLHNRLRTALIRGVGKSTIHEVAGCSLDKLREHFEDQFKDGMSWDNYGKWTIDYIIPRSAFDLTDPIQQKTCFHYSNLQPLWDRENRLKGSKIVNNTIYIN